MCDAQWSKPEPLVEACRPKAKTPPQDLQRTLSAILWRHQNGAKWRAIPEDLGPWWRAAQIFIRWSRAGVWERLLGCVHERGVQLGMVFLDGTNVRAHQKTAGVAKKGGSGAERDHREAPGRSRGGYGTKACVIADGLGRAIAFRLAPVRPANCPTPFLSSTDCRVCPGKS